MRKRYCLVVNHGFNLGRLSERKKLQAQVDKASLIDLRGAPGAAKINTYDCVLSSTKIDNEDVKTPVILGIGLLTGIGEDEVFEEINNLFK